MSTVDANRVILTGENSVIRLSNNDSDSFTSITGLAELRIGHSDGQVEKLGTDYTQHGGL